MKISSRFIRIFALIVLALSIGIGTFFIVASDSEKTSAAEIDNPAASVTEPQKTASTLPVPSLPQPENSPADPYEDVPVVQIGTIDIPKIGVSSKVYDGVSLTVLNVGPGHWPGTASAGEYGNMVIAGHRVTHSRPFRNIDDLVEGDEIIVTTVAGQFVYQVTGHDIVYPKDVWIVNQTPGYRITLFACHPPGSAAQRYVIYGDLVDPPAIPTS